MFSPVHHDLEGLAAERFRSLAGQLRRLQQQHATPERLDAMCRDDKIGWTAAATLRQVREIEGMPHGGAVSALRNLAITRDESLKGHWELERLAA